MRTQKGFAAMFMVLTFLVMGTVLSFSILDASLNAAQTDVAAYRGLQSRLLAESCAEEQLLWLRDHPESEETLSGLPGGECQISVERQDALRIMTVTGIREGYERTLAVRFEILPEGIVLQSWKEISR